MSVEWMREEQVSKGADETREMASRLASVLCAGDLVTLRGPLGAGKTTWAQGMARALGVDAIASPTFVLIAEHEGRVPLLHMDAYRLEDQCFDAIRDAGVFDFLDRDDAVKLVEWPERIEEWLPAPRFAIEIEHGATDDERRIVIQTRQD